MALVSRIKVGTKERYSVHAQIDCTFYSFRGEDGAIYVQLDTFGSKSRKIPGKTSQSLQLDEKSASDLVGLLRQTFPAI